MSDFPALRTGAVVQYPAQQALQFRTSVVRFLDGSEQRFRDYAAPLRRWLIRLELLDESELHTLREFFRLHGGEAGTFAFTDPWDGTQHPNCSFENDTMAEILADGARGSTALAIRTNRE